MSKSPNQLIVLEELSSGTTRSAPYEVLSEIMARHLLPEVVLVILLIRSASLSNHYGESDVRELGRMGVLLPEALEDVPCASREVTNELMAKHKTLS